MYRPTAHPEVVVKVFDGHGWETFHPERQMLESLQDARHVARLLGFRYASPGRSEKNYLVKEFIDGENMSDKITRVLMPYSTGAIQSPLLIEDQKQVAAWLISNMDALTEIHSHGFVVSDFKFSDWPWDRKNQQTTIIDAGNAVNTRRASYDGSRAPANDIDDALKPLIYSIIPLRDAVGMRFGDPLHETLVWGLPIREVGKVLEEKIQDLGAPPSLLKIAQLMQDWQSSPQAYADAFKTFFAEVGLYKPT